MKGVQVNSSHLREYLKKTGIDERQLAYKMGVDYTYVFRVLKGQRTVGGKFITGLLRACPDLEFDDLFCYGYPLPIVKGA